MKKRYSISETALSYNISAQTLRYYDKIGLLKPVEVEGSKYRMYGDREFKQLYMILELKSMGLSLEEIKYFCRHKNVVELEAALRRNNRKLQAKVEELSAVIEHTKFYLDRMLLTMEKDRSKLFEIREMPEQFVYMLNLNFELQDYSLYSKILDETYYNDLIGKEPPNCSRYVVTIDRENFTAGRFKVYNGFGLLIDRPFESKNIITMERGLHAVAYHLGNQATIPETFRALLQFMEQNGYVVDGDLSWLTVIDPYFTDDPEEYVTQVQVRVKPHP